ncbi:hypothetical protein [Mycolicibacterium bacteremicum]|uniref:Tail terminator n=1 Tax=Mycolicibacterium bacteremicum TaxID=564198 RepID=A0A1W9Z0J1_MYCBA|nr:hypothetical protein [Mycolicibacterium bacteremicum]MCV7434815.1 hypothetical protein [Mycolicibacterium bacteremicum]ORA05803.1 hypothetical protein BST17_08595 [Mycolicibacterium bacteremicum]
MTDLHDREAPDSEDFVVHWLAPLLRSATERETDDVLPFAVVQQISGDDDVDTGTAEDAIQVDWFDRARDGMEAAQRSKLTAREGHRRMLLLAHDLPAIEVSDGTTVGADYLTTTMKPTRMPYADEKIVRYVSRYRLGTSFVAAP